MRRDIEAVWELLFRARYRLEEITGTGFELDARKLEGLLDRYSPHVKRDLMGLSCVVWVSGSSGEDGFEALLGPTHAAPFAAFCLYLLGRDAGVPVTLLDAAEAVARTLEVRGPVFVPEVAIRVREGRLAVESLGRSTRDPEGPLYWVDSGCHRLVLKLDDRELVIAGPNVLGRWPVLLNLEGRSLSGVKVTSVPAYGAVGLERNLHKALTLLRSRIAGSGVRLAATVGAERFLERGLRVLGRQELVELALSYLRADRLSASPAYAAAIAGTLAIASAPSNDRPTYLEIARAFGVSAPALMRRYELLLRKSRRRAGSPGAG